MPTPGDVVDVEVGLPEGREAGFRRSAVLVTAQRILDADPSVFHVAPLATTIRPVHSEVTIEPNGLNGLATVSAAQCQHIRAVALRLDLP